MSYSDNQRQHYIEINHLQDSHIDKKLLYQYRRVLPQRKYIGRTESGLKIFFEETTGSLMKRNYGKSDVVTSWTLLYSDGEKSEKLTKNFKEEIIFIEGYSKEYIDNFLKNNNKRTNVLAKEKKERKRYTIWADAEEFEIIQDFIRKLRLRNENN